MHRFEGKPGIRQNVPFHSISTNSSYSPKETFIQLQAQRQKPPSPAATSPTTLRTSPNFSHAQNSTSQSPTRPISSSTTFPPPMVKLSSARESRLYGTRFTRNLFEYINAWLFVFATIVLLSGFVSQLSRHPTLGLVLMMVGLVLVFVVNVHDLMAHMAGIDYRLMLMQFDLGLVEFSVPSVQALGSLLSLLGILFFFLFLQEENGHGYFKLERHALNMLIAGPVLWVLGSIHNFCQIYERADGYIQILQQRVHISFLMGSLLFMVGSILNCLEQAPLVRHGVDLLGATWVWLGMFGSLLFFVGGLMNVVKVFNMQQMAPYEYGLVCSA